MKKHDTTIGGARPHVDTGPCLRQVEKPCRAAEPQVEGASKLRVAAAHVLLQAAEEAVEADDFLRRRFGRVVTGN